jgi:hypothetical protein
MGTDGKALAKAPSMTLQAQAQKSAGWNKNPVDQASGKKRKKKKVSFRVVSFERPS